MFVILALCAERMDLSFLMTNGILFVLLYGEVAILLKVL
jgi:hypothetical protein